MWYSGGHPQFETRRRHNPPSKDDKTVYSFCWTNEKVQIGRATGIK